MKEAYSPVSGCSRKSHYKSLFALTFDQMAPTPKEKDQEGIKILHHILDVFVKWQKSVSINTFALGHDGLQIGHLFNLLPPNFPSKMLIAQGFEILSLRAGHMGQAYVRSIRIVEYIIHTLLQERVFWGLEFLGGLLQSDSMFWPPQWQVQSLVYSLCLCYSVAQWN